MQEQLSTTESTMSENTRRGEYATWRLKQAFLRGWVPQDFSDPETEFSTLLAAHDKEVLEKAVERFNKAVSELPNELDDVESWDVIYNLATAVRGEGA